LPTLPHRGQTMLCAVREEAVAVAGGVAQQLDMVELFESGAVGGEPACVDKPK
jgi:hypothetical protein